MVDTIFSDVAQPDQARIVALNARYFLKNGGHAVISIKVAIVCALVGTDQELLREEGVVLCYG